MSVGAMYVWAPVYPPQWLGIKALESDRVRPPTQLQLAVWLGSMAFLVGVVEL